MPLHANQTQTSNHAPAKDAAHGPTGKKKETVASAAAAKIIHFTARREPVNGSAPSKDGINQFPRGMTTHGASRNKTSITPSWGHPLQEPAAIPSQTALPRSRTTRRISSPFTKHAQARPRHTSRLGTRRRG